MALQKDYINEQNQTIKDCYWRFGLEDGVTGGNPSMHCKIYCYENKEQADLNEGELYIIDFDFHFDVWHSDSLFVQMYKEIREHPSLVGAIDV